MMGFTNGNGTKNYFAYVIAAAQTVTVIIMALIGLLYAGMNNTVAANGEILRDVQMNQKVVLSRLEAHDTTATMRTGVLVATHHNATTSAHCGKCKTK